MRKFLLCCVVAVFFAACGDGETSVGNPIAPSDSSSEIELIKTSSSERESSCSSNETSSCLKNSSSSSEKNSSSSSEGRPSSSKNSSSSSEKNSSSSSEGLSSSSKNSSSSSEKNSSSSSEGHSSSSKNSSSSSEKNSSSSSEGLSSSSKNSSSSSEKNSSSSSEEHSSSSGSSSSSEYYKSNWAYLDKNVVYDTIVDSRDNQVYKVVTIGSQIWMAENLNFFDEKNANDVICLDNEPSNCEKYGRLYNLPVTLGYDSLEVSPRNFIENKDSLNVQGICPNGWRIPTFTEWKNVANKWSSSKNGISILNGSGYYSKKFYTGSVFWTITKTSESRYVKVAFFDVSAKFFYDDRSMEQSNFVSVRCLKKD